MSVWNYVVTAHKPTCVGNFTSPHDVNLIVEKCTRTEILLLTTSGSQHVLEVPIYGRIATLKLFRPHGETQDFLFVATERYKVCVLQWNGETQELVTKTMADVSECIGRPTESCQIGIIDPYWKLIGLHLYDGLFKIIPFDNKGQLKEAFNIRLEELKVLDIKFLYGCSKPTIVVLYQDEKDARHVKTFEVALKNKASVEGPLSKNNLGNGAESLIPVPPPLCGVLIIGQRTIVYYNANALKAIPIRSSITRAYGRVDADGSRYLLGDFSGLLHLLVITHEKEKVTGLKMELLGETSIASTISYLDNTFVYIGSSAGDSQASVELEGIKGLWSLRSSTDDPHDFFLVVIFISETYILALNMEDELEETEIEGFSSDMQTLFCHDAVFNQLIQVKYLMHTG